MAVHPATTLATNGAFFSGAIKRHAKVILKEQQVKTVQMQDLCINEE